MRVTVARSLRSEQKLARVAISEHARNRPTITKCFANFRRPARRFAYLIERESNAGISPEYFRLYSFVKGITFLDRSHNGLY
jgi:hypothetical protein